MKKLSFIFLAILFFISFSYFAINLHAEESVINSEVEVDVVGKDAADAKSQAMAKAEIKALSDLLDKLAPNGTTQDIINELTAIKISKMVKKLDVLDEKINDNHYHAKILVSFDGDTLSELISKSSEEVKDKNIATIGSFLIIPTYKETGQEMLWDNSNTWKNVWKNVGLEITSGDIVVPYGDVADSNIIDIKNLPNLSFASLVPIAIRYGVSDIIVLQAELVHRPDLTLTIIKKTISKNKMEVSVLKYRADPQENREALLTRAARDISALLQYKKMKDLARSQSIRGGEQNKIMMLASISTLESWTKLREKLSALPMIDSIDTLAISAKQVDIIVNYRGSPASLAQAITANNIRLEKNKDYWVVSRD